MLASDRFQIALVVVGAMSGILGALVSVFPPAPEEVRKRLLLFFTFAGLVVIAVVLGVFQITQSSKERVREQHRQAKVEAEQAAREEKIEKDMAKLDDDQRQLNLEYKRTAIALNYPANTPHSIILQGLESVQAGDWARSTATPPTKKHPK